MAESGCALKDQRGVFWHLIGPLQRNKVKRTLPLVGCIDSADSLRLLEEISRETVAQHLIVTDVLIEVNVSGDAAKHGLAPNLLEPLLEEVAKLPKVYVLGLMTMASLEGGPEKARRDFAALRSAQGAISGCICTEHFVQRTLHGHVRRLRDCHRRRSDDGPRRVGVVRGHCVMVMPALRLERLAQAACYTCEASTTPFGNQHAHLFFARDPVLASRGLGRDGPRYFRRQRQRRRPPRRHARRFAGRIGRALPQHRQGPADRPGRATGSSSPTRASPTASASRCKAAATAAPATFRSRSSATGRRSTAASRWPTTSGNMSPPTSSAPARP